MESTRDITQIAKSWLSDEYDLKTREQVQALLDADGEELVDSFYKDLEFGTGGLRGIIGPGTARINRYTIGTATQGLANYILKSFPNGKDLSVAIAHDSRNMSPEFSRIAAEVLSANGIKALLFDSLRPTPELSFTIRELGCQAGIVITASHNPKEYNGYKVYWSDGGQLVPPHDKNIIDEVESISSLNEVKFKADQALIETLGTEIDDKYVQKVKGLSLSPDIIRQKSDFKLVYTPIHGTGVELVPRCLREFGFQNILNVPEQDIPDGNFPTVPSPNPEDPRALEKAIEVAEKNNADLVLATDPDSDRVGIATRDENGKLQLLNGNQIASLLVYYVVEKNKQSLTGNEFIAKTIVTTDLLAEIAAKQNIPCHEVLTGFKFIAENIRLNEPDKKFLVGGEESFGYLVGDFVRDKDAIISCCMIAEVAVWALSKGKTLTSLLKEIYLENSFYLERLVSLTRPGKAGEDEIKGIISNLRENPPKEIDGTAIVSAADFLNGTIKDLSSEKERKLPFPKSNILQFKAEDGSSITVRPSGTEPKIKFYFGVKDELASLEGYEQTKAKLEAKLDSIEKIFLEDS